MRSHLGPCTHAIFAFDLALREECHRPISPTDQTIHSGQQVRSIELVLGPLGASIVGCYDAEQGRSNEVASQMGQCTSYHVRTRS